MPISRVATQPSGSLIPALFAKLLRYGLKDDIAGEEKCAFLVFVTLFFVLFSALDSVPVYVLAHTHTGALRERCLLVV